MAKGYTKKWLTPRNILIYILVGVVVYALVYFLFLSNNNSLYQSQEPTPQAQNGTTFDLGAQNNSGQNGSVSLTEENGKTKVVITLETPSNVAQPAHIHAGACPTPGEVIYPLTNVVNGSSETVLDVDLATLQSKLPLAVNVHESEVNPSVYTSCGDLWTANAQGTASPTSSDSMTY